MLNTMEKTWDIHAIENMTEQDAQNMALEVMEIKEHTAYFIDFPGYFGYSVCVFKDGHHIHYANDYELHHPGKTHEELREWYIEGRNTILFTEQEISEPLKDYNDYERKSLFLHNYYGMRRDYLSIFYIGGDKEKDAERERLQKIYTRLDPIAYAYYKDEDADFIKHHVALHLELMKREEEMKNSYDYWRGAFYYEMGNHEYHINTYQGDWDTLSVFGKIEWHGNDDNELEQYFDELGFNEMQRQAYFDARKAFLKDADKKGWY